MGAGRLLQAEQSQIVDPPEGSQEGVGRAGDKGQATAQRLQMKLEFSLRTLDLFFYLCLKSLARD